MDELKLREKTSFGTNFSAIFSESYTGSFLFRIMAIFVGYVVDELTLAIAIIISQLLLFVVISNFVEIV